MMSRILDIKHFSGGFLVPDDEVNEASAGEFAVFAGVYRKAMHATLQCNHSNNLISVETRFVRFPA